VRTVVVSNIVSLDGSYEGPGGDVMALNMDAAFDAYNLERIRAAGTVLLGRRSFEGFSSYWPQIANAPHDPLDRALSDDNRELSRLYDPLPKIVVSDGLVVPEDNPWYGVTTVVPRTAAAATVTTEKQRGAGDILVFASRTMWNDLLVQGLVDEIHLMVGPRPIPGGTAAFDSSADLQLLDVRRFEGSDNVLLRYAVRR
jgi:dihydrofolate reductase